MTAPTIRRKRPTQTDVARLAAVSQPVVSYVLSDDPLAPVAPATRRRVLAAISELGYVPNRTARSLRTRQTLTIAGIIPDITNPFYPAFERGIQDVADRYGYDFISYNTDAEVDKERRCLWSARQGRVDGIIITPFQVPLAELVPLLEQGIAVVVMSGSGPAPITLPLDTIHFDNRAAARTAVTYLLDRGHTRVAMISGLVGTPPREGRVRGYTEALAERGVPFDRMLVRGGDFTEAGGYETMRELLRLPDRPTAVFAANDLMAMGALLAIREAGWRVPADVALVGFDDIPAARLVSPPLTTIAQFPERQGRRAAELLFERLQGTAAAGPRREESPFALIVRESA